MATLRVSKSGDEWVVKKSGKIARQKRNKRMAINAMNRLARPGDTKIVERANGSVMSKQTEQEPDSINPGLSDDDDSGSRFSFF